MAKKKDAPAAEPKSEEPKAPVMRIASQFVRDLSFENVFAQKGEPEDDQPNIGLQVNITPRQAGEGAYEVSMNLKIDAETKKQKYYIIELEYAGRFVIENVPEDQLHPYLMIECPRMLFPYARRIISDVTRDGGYIPLNIDNIDFVQLYRQELQRRAQAKKEEQPAS